MAMFVFSMTMLVAASNFLIVYVFWEAVGACSYLLIGFWFQKPDAARAAKKAFLVNRIGDFGFAVALFLLFVTYGTLDFHDSLSPNGTILPGILGKTRLMDESGIIGGAIGTAVCLLLLLAACGKSARCPSMSGFPMQWKGPTPASRSDSCSNDGDRWRLSHNAHRAFVCCLSGGTRGRVDRWSLDRDGRCSYCYSAKRSQASARLFDH